MEDEEAVDRALDLEVVVADGLTNGQLAAQDGEDRGELGADADGGVVGGADSQPPGLAAQGHALAADRQVERVARHMLAHARVAALRLALEAPEGLGEQARDAVSG